MLENRVPQRPEVRHEAELHPEEQPGQRDVDRGGGGRRLGELGIVLAAAGWKRSFHRPNAGYLSWKRRHRSSHCSEVRPLTSPSTICCAVANSPSRPRSSTDISGGASSSARVIKATESFTVATTRLPSGAIERDVTSPYNRSGGATSFPVVSSQT